MAFLLPLLLFGPVELRDLEAPTVGVWYHLFYSFDPNAHSSGNWSFVKQCKHPTPAGGIYDVTDPKTIEKQVKQMRDIGINFIVFDHTNGVHVDDNQIDDHIRVWFDWMDKQPEKERLALTLASGGELDQHNDRVGWLKAVDYLWETYPHHPSYAYLGGKPLLNWYIGTIRWDEWDDPRWTVRRTYHWALTAEQGKHEGWGWGSKPLPPPNKECMSIMPGWRCHIKGPETLREQGVYYKKSWLEVLKNNPRFILIGSWNEWGELTSIEDSTEWGSLYTKLTKGYIAAARRKPLEGYWYANEGDRVAYKYRNGKWAKSNPPNNARSVIVVPKGWFQNGPR